MFAARHPPAGAILRIAKPAVVVDPTVVAPTPQGVTTVRSTVRSAHAEVISVIAFTSGNVMVIQPSITVRRNAYADATTLSVPL